MAIAHKKKIKYTQVSSHRRRRRRSRAAAAAPAGSEAEGKAPFLLLLLLLLFSQPETCVIDQNRHFRRKFPRSGSTTPTCQTVHPRNKPRRRSYLNTNPTHTHSSNQQRALPRSSIARHFAPSRSRKPLCVAGIGSTRNGNAPTTESTRAHKHFPKVGAESKRFHTAENATIYGRFSCEFSIFQQRDCKI